ncbi:PREDICTED: UPF0396 protein-like [Polistes dominula]|uniref:UPF0396 protein-like n=1 Tax=Polistes dominula TaxID=743375 RepID=A0ABM1J6C1_POLDO|nr:PREDICTED: UPF0396 protein-like [Polistes dominula]
MNEISENPLVFFVENTHPMFPMNVYQDVGKIIELSDTGCDAISPSSSIEEEKNDEDQSYLKKTLCRETTLSLQKAFDEKQETNREKRNSTKSNVLSKDKAFLRKVKTKEGTKERFKMINSEANEKIDQWKRNIADFENNLLRDQRNLANDSKDPVDPDYIFPNVHNYSMNTEPNDKIRKEFRPAQKQQENKSKIVSNDVRDNAKTSRQNNLKAFNRVKRKMIDRAIDKDDSLSNNSVMFGIFEENMNKGKSKKFSTKEESKEKELTENLHQQRVNRQTNNKKTISKSADFDKSKHRNKSWNKSNTTSKLEEKQAKDIEFVNNDNSRAKVVSHSAGSSSRRVEDIEKDKNMMALSFDDNSDTLNRSINNFIKRSDNRNRVSGNSLARSIRKEGNIERKDLEKIGAIFLASSLRKSEKLANSKTTDNDDHNSKNAKNAKNNQSDQLETPKVNKESCKSEKSIKSRIPIAISRMKNLNYFKDCNRSRSRSRSRLRSRSVVTETDRFNENKIDESTSTAIILLDKSDCTGDDNNDTRLNWFGRKLVESRQRKIDVESKVFKIANDVKEKRRQQFEKCALREPSKKFTNESQEIVDIAVTILEKDSKGETKSSNQIHSKPYSKAYSLRSGMYSKYLHEN